MVTPYTIYVVNQGSSQNFFAFLSKPEVSNNSEIYANSSAYIRIPKGSTNLNSFSIPVQYVVQTGASNNAVGLQTLITSNATRKSDLNQLWDVAFTTVPPNQGPVMPLSPSGTSTPTTIAMKTNEFNQAQNAANGWYQSMSFGVQSRQGFLGLTWNPDSNITYTITPKLVFYIAVGDYQSNTLADINSISNGSAVCDTKTSFNAANECTVTYSATGTFSVAKGRPTQQALESARSAMLKSLS